MLVRGRVGGVGRGGVEVYTARQTTQLDINPFMPLKANSVDPDQTPRIATSDLGLDCLPVSLVWDAGQKLV